MLPAGLSACSKEESNIDTSSMASIGPFNELEKGPFPKITHHTTALSWHITLHPPSAPHKKPAARNDQNQYD